MSKNCVEEKFEQSIIKNIKRWENEAKTLFGFTNDKNTIYKNVHKVEPGNYVTYDVRSKNLKCIKWYNFKKKTILIKNLNEAAEFAEDNIKTYEKIPQKLHIRFIISIGYI